MAVRWYMTETAEYIVLLIVYHVTSQLTKYQDLYLLHVQTYKYVVHVNT